MHKVLAPESLDGVAPIAGLVLEITRFVPRCLLTQVDLPWVDPP